MTIVVLVVLATLWAVVLVPPLVRARSERSTDPIGDFHHRLGVLGRSQRLVRGDPVPSLAQRPELASLARATQARVAPQRPQPRPVSRAAKRRRDVLTVLFGAAGATFVLANALGTTGAWALQVLADVLLVAYVALLWWFRSLQVEQARKVHYLPQQQVPQLALRRTASS